MRIMKVLLPWTAYLPAVSFRMVCSPSRLVSGREALTMHTDHGSVHLGSLVLKS